MTALVWISGELVASDTATVAFDDHGLVVGDGVFETVKAPARRPFALSRHLDRLRRSADGLGLAIGWPDAALADAVGAVVEAHPLPDLRIRITVTGGRSPLSSVRGAGPALVVIAAAPLGERHPSAAVATVPWSRNERGALAGLKTTSYAENVVALRYAAQRGADEAIFANTAGELCEGTGSNVFVVIDGRAVTPPLSSGCLAGVTRALVLEGGGGCEGSLTFEVFQAADEAFLVSTTRDVQPIATIDGRAVRVVGGPVTLAAAAAFAAQAAREG